MTVVIFFSVIAAAAGGFLLFDFCLWRYTGTVTAGKIEGFDKGKPVVSFELQGGKRIRRRVSRVMHLGYMLSNPQPGEIFNVIYRTGETPEARLHGYVGLVGGVFLLIPLPGALALQYGREWLAGQVLFIVVFAGLMVGAWVFLKLLRRSY